MLTGHIAVVGTLLAVALNQFGESHFVSKFAKRFAADEFRSGVGQKSFALVAEVVVDDMSNHSIKHSIAQEL